MIGRHEGGRGAVRSPAGASERPRALLGGVRPGAQAADRQLPAGVHAPGAHLERARRSPGAAPHLSRRRRELVSAGRRRHVAADGTPARAPPRRPVAVVAAEVGATLRRYTTVTSTSSTGSPSGERSTAGRGQVLAPWPNRLDGGRYEFDGVEGRAALDEPELDNAIHGLVRWQPWRAMARTIAPFASRCVLHPQPAYPWRLELEVEYRLEDDGMRVTASARTPRCAACPFGIGFHPYLTLGTPVVDVGDADGRPRGAGSGRDERGLPEGDEAVDGTRIRLHGAPSDRRHEAGHRVHGPGDGSRGPGTRRAPKRVGPGRHPVGGTGVPVPHGLHGRRCFAREPAAAGRSPSSR